MRTICLLAFILSLCPSPTFAEEPGGILDWQETEVFLRYFPPHNEPDPLIGGMAGVTRWQVGGRTQLRLYNLGRWQLRAEVEPRLHLLVDWPDGVESDHGGQPDLLMADFRLFLRRGGFEIGFVGRRAWWFNQDESRDGRYYNGLEIRWVFGK